MGMAVGSMATTRTVLMDTARVILKEVSIAETYEVLYLLNTTFHYLNVL